jgi:predicted dinucleotide-binding enzyme
MKVGILGSGVVGQTLGRGFASKGHDVKIGSRSPDKPELQEWLKSIKGKVSAGTFAEAAAHGEILVIACLGAAVEEVINLAGKQNFSGKLLIDTTVPLDFSKGMPPGLLLGVTDSLGERIQRWLPDAKVVKCFNIVGNATMVNPKMKEGIPDMMICGNDEGAKTTVAGILGDFGWNAPIDVGGIDAARWLEAFVPLWIRLASKLGSWNVAIRVQRS